MPIKICPRCNKTYVVEEHTIDYIHNCNSGNDAIDNEDIVRTGDWQDNSGSKTIGAQAVMRQGAENSLFGTRAAIEGMDEGDHTARGARASTRRQRKHLEFIKIK